MSFIYTRLGLNGLLPTQLRVRVVAMEPKTHLTSCSINPMSADDGKLHIAMFPWLAFGHIIPYLELAKLIAQKGHKVSFISTPRNIDRLPKLPPNVANLINLVKLPLPKVQNLPENAEATIDLPYNKVKYLKIAYDGLQQPITDFLKASSPDWIFYDFAPYWLGPIASELNISSAFFSIFIAAALVFVGPSESAMGIKQDRTKPEDFTVRPPWVPFESMVVFRLFEILRMSEETINDDHESVSDFYRFGSTIQGCDILLVRSCFEFEPEWLKLLQEIHRKPALPVGQLPTTAYDENDDKDKADSWKAMKQWLDKQEKGSVVYVAFGSEMKLSQPEITELALGLEMSELPFFWVLRNRRGLADTELIELPEGFEERTKQRGLVCTSWVPQLRILSHDSVGGFLNHSGWSSVVEAIQCEKALILLPFLGDQGLHARILEEKKIGYSIPRDDRDGSFSSDLVAESLKLVMVKEEGMIYRNKVKEMREVFGDWNIQDKYVNNLLNYVQTHKH